MIDIQYSTILQVIIVCNAIELNCSISPDTALLTNGTRAELAMGQWDSFDDMSCSSCHIFYRTATTSPFAPTSRMAP